MVVETSTFIYVLELKLSNNGGVDAAAEQIKAKQYAEPFKADKRKIIALAVELDDLGKGLVVVGNSYHNWPIVGCTGGEVFAKFSRR